MINVSKGFAFAVLVFLYLTNVGSITAQTIELFGNEYRSHGGKCYIYKYGRPCDRVDPTRVILKYKEPSYNVEGNDILLEHSTERLSLLLTNEYFVVNTKPGIDPFVLAAELLRSAKYEYIGFDPFVRFLSDTPDDPMNNDQWYLSKIRMTDAWNITKGDTNVILAIADLSTAYDHPDLIANNWLANSDPPDTNNYNHGTWVAGVACACTNDSIGISGIAGRWKGMKGVKMISKQTPNTDTDSAFLSAMIAKLKDIADSYPTNKKVINISWSVKNNYSYFDSAITYLASAGCVVVASAGNEGIIEYPAKYSSVIAVGATTESDHRLDRHPLSSGRGAELSLSAPGDSILTLFSNYGYHVLSGTSFSSPMVAGVAALILSTDTSISRQCVKYVLQLSADKIDDMNDSTFSWQYGHGRLNAYHAVRNLYVPDVYPTVAAALEKATSGRAVILTSGTDTLQSEATIKKGVTLEIYPGATLLVRDTLTAIDTSFVILKSFHKGWRCDSARIVFQHNGFLKLNHPLA